MDKIKNRETLVSHGDRESRRIVLDIAEKTLQRLDAGKRIKSIAHLEGDILHIGQKTWDLREKDHVYLIGAGKACNHMAMAIDEILGDRLTRGIAIVKFAEPTDTYRHTEVYVGGHPLPNEDGLNACKKILELVDQATEKDLFITVMSGGSSALMGYPIEGISLDDEIRTTDVLLKSGANIKEINAIRRHISRMNGGMLAKGRLLGLQFDALFTDGLYQEISAHAIAMAEKLREAFTAKGYNYLAPNRTNQIFVIVPDAHLAKISEQFEYSYDQRIDATHSCVRFCTGWATKEENVDALIRCVEKL